MRGTTAKLLRKLARKKNLKFRHLKKHYNTMSHIERTKINNGIRSELEHERRAEETKKEL